MESESPASPGWNARSSSPCSTRARSSSGARIGGLAGALDLGLDLLRQLGDLREPVDGLVDVPAGVRARLERVHAHAQPLEQLLGALERRLRAACHCRSLAIRPRIPLTSLAASSVA